jgi:hypothetical protein
MTGLRKNKPLKKVSFRKKTYLNEKMYKNASIDIA